MFDVFDNRDKCGKPEFMRGNTYTSCISVVLLNHFANKSNTFLFSFPLCLPLSLSHFLPFPPWVSTSSYPGCMFANSIPARLVATRMRVVWPTSTFLVLVPGIIHIV